MKPEARRRLEAAEATLMVTARPPDITPAEQLARMLRLDNPTTEFTPRWTDYSAEELAHAADRHVTNLEAELARAVGAGAALTAGTVEYPAHVITEADRRSWRDGLATRIDGLRGVISLMDGVRGEAAREHPRPATGSPVVALDSLSVMDLLALALRHTEAVPA